MSQRRLGRLFFVSQLCQSAVSFFLVLAAARDLSPQDFGLFSIIWILLTLVGSYMRSLAYEQILTAKNPDHELAAALALAVGLVMSGSVVGLSFAHGGALSAWLIAAGLFWTSDGFRYSIILHPASGSVRPAALDLARAGLGTGAFVVAAFFAWHSAASALACLSGLVWPVAAMSAGAFSRPWERVRSYLSTLGRFEGYLSFQFVLGQGVVQLLPVYALLWLQPVGIGFFRLAQALVAPVAVMAAAMQPALILKLASKPLLEDRWRATLKYLAVAFGGVVCALVVTALLGNEVVSLLVAPESQVGVSEVLLPVSASAMLILLTSPGVALVKTERIGTVGFIAQLFGATAASVSVSILLAEETGPYGLALGVLFGGVVSVASNYALLHRTVKRKGTLG